MRVREFLAALLVIALVIVGTIGITSAFCKDVPDVVVGKSFVPDHYYTYTTFIMVGKVMVPITHTGHKPDEWFLEVTHTTCGNAVIQVLESDYDRYNAGDSYP